LCDNGHHLDCLNPVLDEIPIGELYYVECIQESQNESKNEDDVGEEVVYDGCVQTIKHDVVEPQPLLQLIIGNTRK
jgi:hypothetical protein